MVIEAVVLITVSILVVMCWILLQECHFWLGHACKQLALVGTDLLIFINSLALQGYMYLEVYLSQLSCARVVLSVLYVALASLISHIISWETSK